MKKGKVFIWLSAASGFVGIGMMFGYALGNSTDNKALWIGALLLLLGAILLGMSISSEDPKPNNKPEPTPAKSESDGSSNK